MAYGIFYLKNIGGEEEEVNVFAQQKNAAPAVKNVKSSNDDFLKNVGGISSEAKAKPASSTVKAANDDFLKNMGGEEEEVDKFASSKEEGGA